MGKFFIFKTKETRKHLNLSLVWVNPDFLFPLSEEASQNLDKLSEYSEVFFIFPKSVQTWIDAKKFASLYSAFGYLIADTDSQVKATSDSIIYLLELYGGDFLWHGLTNITVLSEFRPADFDSLSKSFISQFTKSIIPIERISSEDMASVYMRETSTWWSKVKNLLDGWFSDTDNMYWTHSLQEGTKYFMYKPLLGQRLVEFILDPKMIHIISLSFRGVELLEISCHLGYIDIMRMKFLKQT